MATILTISPSNPPDSALHDTAHPVTDTQYYLTSFILSVSQDQSANSLVDLSLDDPQTKLSVINAKPTFERECLYFFLASSVLTHLSQAKAFYV